MSDVRASVSFDVTRYCVFVYSKWCQHLTFYRAATSYKDCFIACGLWCQTATWKSNVWNVLFYYIMYSLMLC